VRIEKLKQMFEVDTLGALPLHPENTVGGLLDRRIFMRDGMSIPKPSTPA